MPAKKHALAAAISLFSLSSCGSTDGAVVSDADRQAGSQQHSMLLAELGGAYSGDEAPYLSQLGDKVAEAAGLGGQCTFTLVNSDVVNAFAVQGCFIYVTRGLASITSASRGDRRFVASV
jgi:predicted Zn-dependent protease